MDVIMTLHNSHMYVYTYMYIKVMCLNTYICSYVSTYAQFCKGRITYVHTYINNNDYTGVA